MTKYNSIKAKEYYQKNKETIKEKRREYNKQYQKQLLIDNPEKYYKYINEKVKNWRLNNPIKSKAHKVVFVELRAGRLKKGICFCGNEKVEAHHEDYTKPLDIIWLCKKHHAEYDMKLRDN